MTHPLDRSQADNRDRKAASIDVAREEIFRRNVQVALNDKATRAVLIRFFEETGLDRSPFNPHGSVMTHALGMQDAAKWWVNAIREHCPEKEAVLRIEAKNVVVEIANEEEQNAD